MRGRYITKIKFRIYPVKVTITNKLNLLIKLCIHKKMKNTSCICMHGVVYSGKGAGKVDAYRSRANAGVKDFINGE